MLLMVVTTSDSLAYMTIMRSSSQDFHAEKCEICGVKRMGKSDSEVEHEVRKGEKTGEMKGELLRAGNKTVVPIKRRSLSLPSSLPLLL